MGGPLWSFRSLPTCRLQKETFLDHKSIEVLSASLYPIGPFSFLGSSGILKLRPDVWSLVSLF